MTTMSSSKRIPIVPVAGEESGDCSAAEPFVLMVLGDSMAPEFSEGEIVVVEPEGHATDGSFVVAQLADGWTLRQLARTTAGWELRALDPASRPTAPDRKVVV